MVANAPLKLPTGVRAALTMTTSSDMGISWGFEGRWQSAKSPEWQASLFPHPVNVVEACQLARGRNRAAAHSI
jgi:hypothetical protein